MIPESQPCGSYLLRRAIDSGGIRVVLRSLHADFENAAAQVSHADDDNHLTTILNAAPIDYSKCRSHSFSSVLYSVRTMPLQFQLNAAPEGHPVAKDRN